MLFGMEYVAFSFSLSPGSVALASLRRTRSWEYIPSDIWTLNFLLGRLVYLFTDHIVCSNAVISGVLILPAFVKYVGFSSRFFIPRD
jgi:hypothetical protein